FLNIDPEDENQGDKVEDTSVSIKMTTINGSKGMSANYVFLIGMNNGEFPKSAPNPTDNEICQLIVGLTRTRKKCYLISNARFGLAFGKSKSVFIDWINPEKIDRGKKEGGWGEGIFARLLPFPFRLSKRKAEGGFGGNSAFLLPNQNEASPATCLNTWKAEHHRKILFSLGEKEIGRAQNEKSKEYFSVVWRACRAVAGLASLSGVLLKKCSNYVQKTPQ
ncbi:MAG: hypothetical protein HYU99_08705, partial [Deltaproteobacteria bacterium]|nr:hypothetical protein [Deltaproteobacteria bacterium]